MSTPHVLVAYASKNGSTEQIAGWIADVLSARGTVADVRPAGQVDGLAGYDAVVLGSGVYAGRWLRDATRFARRNRKRLRELPVWLFSSGPLDAEVADRAPALVRGAVRVADMVDAADQVTFGGRLDDSARGFVARQILKQGKGGDFRDRDRIRAWASGIADQIAAAWGRSA
ncbi:flavodoxin domain-containing protein [Streptomyces cocklensis]|jgi:menaquinone-dependent protoporphyrinogen oxidase|uniref:Menaquinone-dependent protoporphyrinogen oxidase n=1 Tax=Actinacidiphila cocklensis TaxID=887465 RepID=A0A9W4EAD2_9ACTN|nr:flavodoxin domain-containing protein [Actinacidiphila cocklensis]MDD1059903.1 flavodoxin domain-containing protein [Actinacidiphila cocklensis]WSX72766.1 flavodoxin domain-containing protein [Streptomyces sp. NBC_00899]WSX81166.1 flavodoxin domain-containing protein [Streptomyces sp. NBC_00899]CAG6397213.1 Menaquinone-dependent protoporphyrinogen oxidase [Actinacidiphila cocklensis]